MAAKKDLWGQLALTAIRKYASIHTGTYSVYGYTSYHGTYSRGYLHDKTGKEITLPLSDTLLYVVVTFTIRINN